ncbi:MAG: DUF1801 domain-containing protein [Casimicrobium sp.]
MAEAKTQQNDLSVDAYVEAITDEARRKDCCELSSMMRGVTKCEPKMWGTGIVGFGTYHYTYASGHEGAACLTGFAARKGDISIYLMSGFEGDEVLFAKLGKHKMGKACLYVRRLSDIELPILKELVSHSVAEVKRRYP